MVQLIGPAPEEMKPGELYRVVEKEGDYHIEKLDRGQSSVTLELSKKVYWLAKIYSTILDDTIENLLLNMINELAEQWGEGWILGEEIAAKYDKMTKQDTPAPP